MGLLDSNVCFDKKNTRQNLRSNEIQELAATYRYLGLICFHGIKFLGNPEVTFGNQILAKKTFDFPKVVLNPCLAIVNS